MRAIRHALRVGRFPLLQPGMNLIQTVFLTTAVFAFSSPVMHAQMEFVVVTGNTADLDDTWRSDLAGVPAVEAFDEYTHGETVTSFGPIKINSVVRVGSTSAQIEGAFFSRTLATTSLTVEFELQVDYDAFGLWVYDAYNHGYAKFRLGAEDEDGLVSYSEFWDTGLLAFMGVKSITPLKRVWMETHELNSTAEEPVLRPGYPYNMDHITYGHSVKSYLSRAPVREVAGTEVIEYIPTPGVEQTVHLRFESKQIHFDRNYVIQSSLDQATWINHSEGLLIEPSLVLAELELRDTVGSNPIWFRLVEDRTSDVQLAESQIQAARNGFQSDLEAIKTELTELMNESPLLQSSSALPGEILGIVNEVMNSLTEAEQNEAIQYFYASGTLSSIKQIAGVDLIAPQQALESASTFEEGYRPLSYSYSPLSPEIEDYRWEMVQQARTWLKFQDDINRVSAASSMSSTLFTLRSAARSVAVASLIGNLITVSDIIIKSSFPARPTELKVFSTSGLTFFYPDIPSRDLVFYMDFRSQSNIARELLNNLLFIFKNTDYRIGLLNDGVTIWKGYPESYKTITSEANQALIESLDGETGQAIISYLEELSLKLNGLLGITWDDIQVDPAVMGIEAHFYAEAPRSIVPIQFNPAESNLSLKNSRMTGQGYIGFSFTETLVTPAFTLESPENPEDEHLYYYVPNFPPQYGGASAWEPYDVMTWVSYLRFEDKHKNLPVIDRTRSGAVYGDIDWEVLSHDTVRLTYRLNDKVASEISLDSRSTTTTSPFTVLVSDLEKTSFDAVIRFSGGIEDTITLVYKDDYADLYPDLSEELSYPDSIRPAGFDQYADPVEIGVGVAELLNSKLSQETINIVSYPESGPTTSSFLQSVEKTGIHLDSNEFSQTFALQQKAGVEIPQSGGWEFWIRADFLTFSKEQRMIALAEEGDQLPPVISRLEPTKNHTYEVGNYTLDLTAGDSENAITHWYYRVAPEAGYRFLSEDPSRYLVKPEPDDPNWIPFDGFPSMTQNRVIELEDSHPFFEAPDGVDKDWHLHLWVKDAVGNVSPVTIVDLPIAPIIYTDPRDGKKYNTVVIGNLQWFQENLAYNKGGSRPQYGFSELPEVLPPGWRGPTVFDFIMTMDWLGMKDKPIVNDPNGAYLALKEPGSRLMEVLQLLEGPIGSGGDSGPWYTRNATYGLVGWMLTATRSGSSQYAFSYVTFQDGKATYQSVLPPFEGGEVRITKSGFLPNDPMILRPVRPVQ